MRQRVMSFEEFKTKQPKRLDYILQKGPYFHQIDNLPKQQRVLPKPYDIFKVQQPHEKENCAKKQNLDACRNQQTDNKLIQGLIKKQLMKIKKQLIQSVLYQAGQLIQGNRNKLTIWMDQKIEQSMKIISDNIRKQVKDKLTVYQIVNKGLKQIVLGYQKSEQQNNMLRKQQIINVLERVRCLENQINILKNEEKKQNIQQNTKNEEKDLNFKSNTKNEEKDQNFKQNIIDQLNFLEDSSNTETLALRNVMMGQSGIYYKSDSIYYVDQYNVLMDELGQYILDPEGKQIVLSQDQISILKRPDSLVKLFD